MSTLKEAPPPSRWGLWVGFGIVFLMIGVIGYISTFKTNPSGLANPDDQVQVARGQQAYQATCAQCHGAKLQGEKDWRRANVTPRPAPPLNNSGPAWQRPDREIHDILRDPEHIAGKAPDADTAWAILAYLKSGWGDKEAQFQYERTMRDQTSQ